MTLTTKEAAKYSSIGINKIDSILRTPNHPFALFVGTKRFVRRKEFEPFSGWELSMQKNSKSLQYGGEFFLMRLVKKDVACYN